jgi:hypothetical protein
VAQFAKPALRVISVLDGSDGPVGDVFGALKPFFAPVFLDRGGEMFDPQEIADDINQRYFWRITPEIIEAQCARFEKWGWLTRLPAAKDTAAFVINAESICEEEESGATDVAALATQLGESFRAFLDKHLPELAGNATPSVLASDLIEWLVSIDAFTSKSIREQIQGYEVDEFGRMLPKFSGTHPANTLNSQTSYMCARFAKHLADTEAPLFEDLTRLAEVGLLTEVVQDFAKPTGAVTQTDVIVYLDSPLALDALGMSGRAAKDSILPVMDALRSIGARVCVLRVSVEELKTSLHALLQTERSYRTGPTADALRRKEIVERDVISVWRAPEAALLKLGIGTDERTLSMYPNEHKFFPYKDYEALKAIYGKWAPTWAAQEHDATLVAMTMRKRGTTRSSDILSSKAVSVSKNGSVISDAEAFCAQRDMLARGQVPPVVHSKQLATTVWLRTGLRDSYDVPRATLLAACQRVLSLSPRLIETAISKARELSDKTDEELRACLTVDRSAMVLLDKTAGDPRLLTGKDIAALLDSMKRAVAAEEVEKARTELEAEKRLEAEAAAQALRDAKAALIAKEQEAEALEAERSALRNELSEQAKVRDRLSDMERDLEAKAGEIAQADEKVQTLTRMIGEREAAERAALDLAVADVNKFVGSTRVTLKWASVFLVVLSVVLSFVIGWDAIPFWLVCLAVSLVAFVGITTNLATFLHLDVSIYRLTTPLCAWSFRTIAKIRGLSDALRAYEFAFEKDTVRIVGPRPGGQEQQ